jgi:hypothetical protein
MGISRLNFFFNLSYTTKNIYKFRISMMRTTRFANFIPLALVSY